MRNLRSRLRSVQAKILPPRLECSGVCLGFCLDMVRQDAETGERFIVCIADQPIWQAEKGTDWPATIRDYEAFKVDYMAERAWAHRPEVRPRWRASGGGNAK